MVALLLGSCGAYGQTLALPPTPTDLHAAYCVESLKEHLQFEEQALNSINALIAARPMPPASAASSAGDQELTQTRTMTLQEISNSNASLQRIELYLNPRVGYLDPTGLMAAMVAAKNDVSRISATVRACSRQCPIRGTTTEEAAQLLQKCVHDCVEKAMPDADSLSSKLKSCRAPSSWLPF
jgi:hypothetical protein